MCDRTGFGRIVGLDQDAIALARHRRDQPFRLQNPQAPTNGFDGEFVPIAEFADRRQKIAADKLPRLNSRSKPRSQTRGGPPSHGWLRFFCSNHVLVSVLIVEYTVPRRYGRKTQESVN